MYPKGGKLFVYLCGAGERVVTYQLMLLNKAKGIVRTGNGHCKVNRYVDG